MERRVVLHTLYLLSALLIFGLLLIVRLRTDKVNNVERPAIEKHCVDLDQILERGRLDVSLGYNSLNYYILHGKPAGFQFELARYFSAHLGVELNIWVTNDIHNAISALTEGKIDIVCADLTKIDNRFGNEVLFTESYAAVSQFIVQRKDNPKHDIVTEVVQLSGKTIYVPRGSIYKGIIENHVNIHPAPIVIEVADYSSEQLIDAVAEGKISFTVADSHLAKYHKGLYNNIDVSLEIGQDRPLAWCVRKESPQLFNEFNNWIHEFMKTRQFGYLYHRYFVNPWKQDKISGNFFSVKKGKISPYDDVIRKYSREIGWDWRLVASLIYEESKFHHDLVSYSGAYGIMQLIPVTAETFGVSPESPPEEHIQAGIKFIKKMDDNFKHAVPDSVERRKFVLASYNLGEGHIWDAIALARKFNKNPQLWDNNVEYYLIAKNQSKFYMDEVVQYGYCKGWITSNFVKSILERYEHYKNAFPENY